MIITNLNVRSLNLIPDSLTFRITLKTKSLNLKFQVTVKPNHKPFILVKFEDVLEKLLKPVILSPKFEKMSQWLNR